MLWYNALMRKGFYDQDSWTDKINIRDFLKKPQTVAFLLTFSTILVIGIPALLIFGNLKYSNEKYQKGLFTTKWEAIPEAGRAENAAVTDEESAKRAAIIYEGDEDYTHVIGTADPETVTIGFAGDILFDPNYAVGDAFRRAGNTAAFSVMRPWRPIRPAGWSPSPWTTGAIRSARFPPTARASRR